MHIGNGKICYYRGQSQKSILAWSDKILNQQHARSKSVVSYDTGFGNVFTKSRMGALSQGRNHLAGAPPQPMGAFADYSFLFLLDC